MIKVTAVVYLLAGLVAAGVVPESAPASIPGHVSSETALLGANAGPLLMCDDIPPVTSGSEDRDYLCTIPAPNATAFQASAQLAAPAGELVCTLDAIAPNSADANNLCNLFVPNTEIVVPQAPSPGTCACRIYARNAAEFRVCNCDYCNQLGFTNPQSDCLLIKNNCVSHGLGGYRAWEDLPLSYFTVLFLPHSMHPTPVLDSCYRG
ncbi:hypothetical protein C8Q76DRAFT_266695 [Earliella scabrosa]|nr:hypothetical protein C8Q76DRAFT_266695 [Earliella scabrosa]